MDERVIALEIKVQNLADRVLELASIGTSIQNLAKAVEMTALEQTHIRESLVKLDSKVEEMERQPAKRFELLITGIITAAVGYVAARLFGG